jgi:hypothetical protein
LRAFLDGIEGFDSIRAAECLSRLVDAGYDTIGVLKLAKKRDLIEDAGLKLGYALRIVSAAQKAVAPSHSNQLKNKGLVLVQSRMGKAAWSLSDTTNVLTVVAPRR